VIVVLTGFLKTLSQAESLTCNKCTFGLLGVCLNQAEETCSTNTSVCFTGRATFPSLTAFVGFNTQGCREPSQCTNTTTGTLLGVTYESKIECCSKDKCNPITISGAPSTKMSLTVAITAAVLASVWGSML
uniref:UPAR/Ly6 domain-containing protein n=1 Tax=Sphaeramia orbicularis TaxID=375764 RepID=A0A672Z7G4_9TELE